MRIDENKFQARMADRGWTQRQLAEALGRSPANVAWMVVKARKKRHFRAFTVGRLALALGCPVEELIADTRRDGKARRTAA